MTPTQNTTNGAGHRSTRELLTEIIRDIQDIIRSELRLAKTEFKEEGAKAGKAAGMFGAAGLLGFYGVGLVLAMCVVLLAAAMPLWSALLIMALVTLAGGGICFAAAMTRWRQIHPMPEKTVATIKDDIQWAKNPTR
jgi:uncharacterized membrane protein YqjE